MKLRGFEANPKRIHETIFIAHGNGDVTLIQFGARRPERISSCYIKSRRRLEILERSRRRAMHYAGRPTEAAEINCAYKNHEPVRETIVSKAKFIVSR